MQTVARQFVHKFFALITWSLIPLSISAVSVVKTISDGVEDKQAENIYSLDGATPKQWESGHTSRNN